MNRYDSGLLLLTSDFRKTLVSKQQSSNGETEQIRKALVNYRYTNLNESDKRLLAHDLSFIFSKLFYDFENGCLLSEKSRFFRSDETLFFFADYLLYFSFISSLYERPRNADTILNDIQSPESRKSLFSDLREPLSPYLFVTFIHNLIDTINLSLPSHDTTSIENEMCRQLMINAKELSQLNKFIELHKNLLEKVKNHFKKLKKKVSKEMENNYTFFFAHAFYQTLVYPSDYFKDPDFKDMTKNLLKIQRIGKNEINPIIESFSYEKDLLSFHTYLYQRAMCIEQKDCWVHPSEEKETFLYPAQLRLTIISKKVGELMSNDEKPIGNTVVIIIIPIDQSEYNKIIVNFKYNKKNYQKRIVDGLVDCVFPCFKDSNLEISFLYQNKKNNKDTFIINSIANSTDTEIMKEIKFGGKQIPVVVSAKFYSHDKPLENLVAHLNSNPKNLFNFVAEAFLHKYFTMNAQFIYVHRGEDDCYEDTEDDPSENLFKTSTNLRISQDFSGRAFPSDFWLFLIDIAIKHSIPSSYFFARLTEILNRCWCTAQAYINFYCIVLYNLYYAINNSEHTKEEEELFEYSIKMIKEKCIRLLMNQLAKPEIYQRPSITSLILLLSLANEGNNDDLSDLLKTIFLSSMNNINSSIYNILQYQTCEKECVSMDLFNKLKNKPAFPEGPNHLPLCNVTVESLKKALDLVLYRCRSISSFFLESFLPSFANIGDNIISDLKIIAIDIAKAFNNMDPPADQKDLVSFISIYQQLYQLFRKDKEINPAILFNDSIEQWLFDLSASMIELVERSIKYDNFEKRSEKSRTSDSFYEIFLFFKQGFDFITSLYFTQQEVKDKLFYFLSINAAICSTYIEILLSMVSKQFRGSFNQPVQLIDKIAIKKPVKQKSFFPSWCPDITENRMISFENMCVMINNVALIRLKWFKYIVIYDKYLPNQPQIAVALKATANRKSIKSDQLSANLILNENEEEIEESKDTFKDPCSKLTTKVIFMINFLRLDLTYTIIGLLNNKMWTVSPLNKVMIKQLNESFFSESVQEKENIRIAFDTIFDEFKSRVQKVKDFLQISLHLKCIPQLIRAMEDGIFECMIPLAFSIKSKNVFSGLTKNIDNLFTDAFNFIEEAGFGKEIVNRSVKALRFMPYVRSFIHLTPKEVEEELKKEKSSSDCDFNNNIILLNIVLQVITPVPLPKTVNPSYTFITLE